MPRPEVARPRTFKLVAAAKRSSNSLLGTLTSPQYINCNNLSKCRELMSRKKTMGCWSDRDNLGGCRVNMARNKGLHAQRTNRCASKTRSPHHIVTSVKSSCCSKSSAKAKKEMPWSFHRKMYSSSMTLTYLSKLYLVVTMLVVLTITSDVVMLGDSRFGSLPTFMCEEVWPELCHHSNSAGTHTLTDH